MVKEENIYYIANNGDDNSDGKSPESAWRTLQRVSCEGRIKSGDRVLFRRGDLFRGTLIAKEGVTYSAFGEGDNPILTYAFENSAKEIKWYPAGDSGRIWMYERILPDVGRIVFDKGHGEAKKYTPILKNGEFFTAEDEKTPFDTEKHLKNHMIFSDIRQWKGADSSFGMLYLRCDEGNPGKIFEDIEICSSGNAVECNNTGVKLENIDIKYCGDVGVCASVPPQMINCNIEYTGGAIRRYRDDGNAEICV